MTNCRNQERPHPRIRRLRSDPLENIPVTRRTLFLIGSASDKGLERASWTESMPKFMDAIGQSLYSTLIYHVPLEEYTKPALRSFGQSVRGALHVPGFEATVFRIRVITDSSIFKTHKDRCALIKQWRYRVFELKFDWTTDGPPERYAPRSAAIS